jgi:peptidoglycan/xylan/chitin deacetylase (PgdA/CDA1 family)
VTGGQPSPSLGPITTVPLLLAVSGLLALASFAAFVAVPSDTLAVGVVFVVPATVASLHRSVRAALLAGSAAIALFALAVVADPRIAPSALLTTPTAWCAAALLASPMLAAWAETGAIRQSASPHARPAFSRRLRKQRRTRRLLSAAAAAFFVSAAVALSINTPHSTPRQPAVAQQPVLHVPTAHARPWTKTAPAATNLAAARRYALLGFPVYCGASTRRLVALTFDDGPGPHTAALLRLLHAAGAPATFFEIGHNVDQWPQLARAEAATGTIGDHTWSHPRLTTLTTRAIRSQLADARVAIMHATDTQVVLFRPPYEVENARVNRLAREAGLLPVLWSVDSNDWKPVSLATIKHTLAPQLRPGAIILFHEQGKRTLPALRWLLVQLRQRDLRPVTVPELLALDGPKLAQLRLDARARACVRP